MADSSAQMAIHNKNNNYGKLNTSLKKYLEI